MLLSFEIALPVALALLSAAPASAEPTFGLYDSIQKLASDVLSKSHRLVGLNSCPAPTFLPRSCSNGASPPDVDGCCTNTPGGYFLATQFWDANPPTGPDDAWTLHGLWPDNCDGTYQAFCDPARAYTDIRGKLQKYGPSDLVPFMDTYWKDYQGNDESFWEHEWSKHGTCISTLNTTCYGPTYTPYEELVDYFERATDLYKSLPTYKWLADAGIVPSTTKTYTLAELQAVAKKNHGYEAIFNCQKGELNEAWYGYVSRGPVQGGKFVPTSPDGSKSTCPTTGIKYLPKGSGSSTGGGSTGGGSTGGTTGSKVFLNVVANGAQNGCLISSGKWYTTGTCGGYTIIPTSDSSSDFTMTTSKGPCAVSSSGDIACAAGLTPSVFSKDANNHLTYSSSASFFASEVATGQSQVTVSTQQQAVALTLVYAPQ